MDRYTGTILKDRFVLEDVIGSGGMAVVYRATDRVTGNTVAVKILKEEFVTDEQFRRRFLNESRAISMLRHRNIVSVIDFDFEGNLQYIVMEYVDGITLKDFMRSQKIIPSGIAIKIIMQTLSALQHAHERGVIHRDIKPQNIMILTDGTIKVMDFGIARAKNSHLTQDNSVLGTAHYVSPEQTQGKELGPTTDIYSLGIVMYESATGQVPFKGDDAISVALKQVNEQPMPPSQLNPNVDPSLEAIILKCMQKDPAARFQTADELNRALRDYLAGRLAAVAGATAAMTSPIAAGVTNKLEPGEGATAVSPRIQRDNRYRPQTATEQAAEQEAERERKHSRNKKLGIFAAIALLAVIGAVVMALLNSGTKNYPIPNLSGLTKDQAIEAIEKDGHFQYKFSEQYDSNVEEGYVVDQNPNQGREFPEGTVINFTVSKGPAPAAEVTVPDLSNMTPEEAEAELAKYKLTGKSGNSEPSDDVEVGHVCRQSPGIGTSAKAGDTITYYLSSGPNEVEVPNVSGYSENNAKSTLKAAGFTDISVVYDNSDTVTSGLVVRTDPSAGTKTAANQTITVTVSTGPSDKRVDVPYVVGESYSDARYELASAGFNVTLADGCSANGTVTYQSVTSKAEKGTTIVLTTKTQSTGDTTGGNGGGNAGGEDANGQ